MIDPLLIEVPESFQTDRLDVRAPAAGEGQAVNAAILDSIEQLQLWMPWATPTPTIEQSESHSRESAAKFRLRQDLPYRGWLRGTDTYVVGSGLHRIDWEVPRFEIGFWVRTPFAGQGYATEIVRALAALAFEQLNAARVEIRCDALNQRSRHVAERTGFIFEGTHRRDSRGTNGELRDTCVYAKTR